MATEGPGRAGVPSLTSLPRYEDIPQSGDGLDADRVREAFDAFRRHAAQLQAQLRVLQAAGARTGPSVEPTGHAVRMDALHLIRAAAEFADTIERDAQNASAAQLGKTEEEVSRRQRDLQEREGELDRYRQEAIAQVAGAIVRAAESAGEAARPQAPAAAFSGPAAVSPPAPPVAQPPVAAPPVAEPPATPPPPTSSSDEEPAGGDPESSGS